MNEQLKKACNLARNCIAKIVKKGYESQDKRFGITDHASNARDAAYSASDKANASGKQADHDAAADAHAKAAEMNYGEVRQHHMQQEAHHRAYTRTSQSGAVSNIQQKGEYKYRPGDTVIVNGKKKTLLRRKDANGMARWELTNGGFHYEGDED